MVCSVDIRGPCCYSFSLKSSRTCTPSPSKLSGFLTRQRQTPLPLPLLRTRVTLCPSRAQQCFRCPVSQSLGFTSRCFLSRAICLGRVSSELRLPPSPSQPCASNHRCDLSSSSCEQQPQVTTCVRAATNIINRRNIRNENIVVSYAVVAHRRNGRFVKDGPWSDD